MNDLVNSGENYGVIAKYILGSVTVTPPAPSNNIPALLPSVIENIAALYIKSGDKPDYSIPKKFNIEAKIDYNEIKKYRIIIKEYGAYYKICDSALNELDDNKPNSKNKVLNSIHDHYLHLKAALISDPNKEMEIIRENSDLIIDIIKQELESKIKASFTGEMFFMEDLGPTISIFLCYVFAECKILEKPE